jgi:hypothetical protein
MENDAIAVGEQNSMLLGIVGFPFSGHPEASQGLSMAATKPAQRSKKWKNRIHDCHPSNEARSNGEDKGKADAWESYFDFRMAQAHKSK